MSKAQLSVWTDSKWFSATCVVVGVIVGVIVMLFIAVTAPCFLRARGKANFAAGVEQLKNIGSGLQQQISEKGSLKGIKTEDDICHHILPGFKEDRECKGRVKEQANEICLKDTLNVKILGDFSYEIRAQSNEKSQCRICVTESAVRPDHYDPSGACREFTCVHSNK